MSNKEKGALIGNILTALKFEAAQRKKAFDYGDTFFALCFKSDDELAHIAKLCGI